MTDLSSTAQAVMDAFYEGITYADEISPSNVAAALRALDSRLGHEILGVRGVDCSQIQLIADELDDYALEQLA